MKIRLFFIALTTTLLGYSQSFELFDFNTSGDFQPKHFTEYNGTLIFQAKDTEGVELWKTDGTQAGTVKIKDINPNGSSNPRNFFVFNGKLYFIASSNNSTFGELWKTDGSQAGTLLVSNQVVPQGAFAVSNNLLLFVGDNNPNGKELWATDGTNSGTYLVKDINPSTWDALQFNSQLIAYNNVVIFSANDGSNGKELWKSDGTESGTEMIKDIKGGNESSGPKYFTEYKSKIYFAATTLDKGEELWKTDGTTSGTVLVKDIFEGEDSSNPAKLFVYSESLFFQANSDDGHGIEMHKYNLVTNVITREADVYDGQESGGFSPVITYNEGMYFLATKPATGNELYVRRNGFNSLAEDTNTGSGGSSSSVFCNCGDKMYYRAYDGSENALFEFDTSGNATKLKPSSAINEAFFTSITTELFCFNNELYFAANYTNSGYDLWKYSNTTLSIENIEFNSKKISVFPNPANASVIISLKSVNDHIDRVEFYNILGQQVYKEHVNYKKTKEINVSNLNVGVYFVKVKGEKKVYSKRIIINRN